MPEIPENWPNWLTLILATLYILRGALVKLLPTSVQTIIENVSARRAGQAEHNQEIEEVELNARLQTQASEQLRKSWREEMLLEIIQTQQAFVQDILLGEIRALAAVGHQTHEELRNAQRAIHRSANLTATLITCLHGQDPAKMLELADEIGDVIEGLNSESKTDE